MLQSFFLAVNSLASNYVTRRYDENSGKFVMQIMQFYAGLGCRGLELGFWVGG